MSQFSAVAEQPPIPTAPGSAAFEQTTLGEYGQRLPVGILHEGQLHKEFALRRWNTTMEREIETARREKKALAQPDFVLEVLSRMVTRLGPHDFDAMSPAEKRVVLQSAWMADIMVLWTWLRIKALGKDVRFRLDCQACRAELRPEVDLEDTDIKVVGDPGQLVWRHTLRDGIVMDGTAEKDVLLQPPRWSILLGSKNRKTIVTDLKVSIAVGTIRAVGDGKRMPTRAQLDDMEKFDLEHLQKTVDDHAPGIEMELAVDCDQCGHNNRYGFEWAYDFFFTASSL